MRVQCTLPFVHTIHWRTGTANNQIYVFILISSNRHCVIINNAHHRFRVHSNPSNPIGVYTPFTLRNDGRLRIVLMGVFIYKYIQTLPATNKSVHRTLLYSGHHRFLKWGENIIFFFYIRSATASNYLLLRTTTILLH